jgi:uncharacterized protein (DUF433 family)
MAFAFGPPARRLARGQVGMIVEQLDNKVLLAEFSGRLERWNMVLRRAMNGKRNSAMNTLLNRITIDPQVCGGKPCVRGTRIWVSLILDFLADGMREEELLAEYPQLVHEDVLAAIAYGAEAARERIIPIPFDGVA